MKKNHGPWSLLPEGLLVLVLIFSKVYYVPGPYMGGPYKMIMRVTGWDIFSLSRFVMPLGSKVMILIFFHSLANANFVRIRNKSPKTLGCKILLDDCLFLHICKPFIFSFTFIEMNTRAWRVSGCSGRVRIYPQTVYPPFSEEEQQISWVIAIYWIW